MEDARYYHKRHSIGSRLLFKAIRSIDYIKPLKNCLTHLTPLPPYLLAQLGGDASPSKDKIKSILDAVGITVDDAAIDALLAKVDGKNVEELIAEGSSKLSVFSAGDGAAGPAAAGAAPAEEKKEENREHFTELDGGFDDLFGSIDKPG